MNVLDTLIDGITIIVADAETCFLAGLCFFDRRSSLFPQIHGVIIVLYRTSTRSKKQIGREKHE